MTRDPESLVNMCVGAVDACRAAGLRADYAVLARRLAALRRRVDRQYVRAAGGWVERVHRTETEAWIETSREVLLPRTQEKICRSLSRGGARDALVAAWTGRAVTDAVDTLVAGAVQIAARAFRAEPSPARAADLISAVELFVSSSFDQGLRRREVPVAERDLLVGVLSSELPPLAYEVLAPHAAAAFARMVDRDVLTEVNALNRSQRFGRPHVWSPAWDGLRSGYGAPDEAVPVFIPQIQREFEELVAERQGEFEAREEAMAQVAANRAATDAEEQERAEERHASASAERAQRRLEAEEEHRRVVRLVVRAQKVATGMLEDYCRARSTTIKAILEPGRSEWIHQWTWELVHRWEGTSTDITGHPPPGSRFPPAPLV